MSTPVNMLSHAWCNLSHAWCKAKYAHLQAQTTKTALASQRLTHVLSLVDSTLSHDMGILVGMKVTKNLLRLLHQTAVKWKRLNMGPRTASVAKGRSHTQELRRAGSDSGTSLPAKLLAKLSCLHLMVVNARLFMLGVFWTLAPGVAACE